MKLTKRLVKSRLGYETDAELARFFKIGRWAVGQWPDDEAIPEGRQWELIARKPDVFGKTDPSVQESLAANDAAGTGGDGTELKDAA